MGCKTSQSMKKSSLRIIFKNSLWQLCRQSPLSFFQSHIMNFWLKDIRKLFEKLKFSLISSNRYNQSQWKLSFIVGNLCSSLRETFSRPTFKSTTKSSYISFQTFFTNFIFALPKNLTKLKSSSKLVQMIFPHPTI